MRLRFCLPGFFVFGLALFLTLPTASHAQQNAKLFGTVTDDSGAVVPGAMLTVVPLGTSGAARVSAHTGADGGYSVMLPAGQYRVTVERTSFTPTTQDLAFSAGESHEWNVRLELAVQSSSVIVSDSLSPQLETATISQVDVISSTNIDHLQQLMLAPALNTQPGATIARLGPYGGVTSFFLDGGNSDFTKFLVDGVPMNQPGGAIDLSNLDVANLDKIEVVHGASSALYGSDALTGVVQLMTHRGDTKIPIIEAEGSGGTFGTGYGLLQLSGLARAFDYSAEGSYFSTEGQGVYDQFKNTGLSGNFGYKINQDNQVRLTVRSDDSYADQPGQTLLEPPAVGQNARLLDFFAGVSWDSSISSNWQNHLAGTEAYNRGYYAPYDDLNQFNRAGFSDQLTYLFHNGGVTFGYEYEVENGRPDGPNVRRNNMAGYSEVHYNFTPRFNVVVGGRVEDNAQFGTRFVPRLGGSYTLRYGNEALGATRIHTSYGEGIKESSFGEEYSGDPCFPGNPQLDPERSKTFGAGIEQLFASNRVKFSVDYFHNEFYDIVSFTSGPITPTCPYGSGTYYNTDKARAYGANSKIEAKVTNWLSIAGNYSYDNSRVLVSPNATDPSELPGNRLFLRPLNSANLIVNARFRKTNWNLAGTYVGRRTDSDFLGLGYTSTPSFVRWDFAAIVPIHYGFSVTTRVENLFDKQYQDAIGYPALGRSYLLGMRYVWGGDR
ncbi:MAG: TonB-dependent receptor [Candidatus Acidiferrales bacterium]